MATPNRTYLSNGQVLESPPLSARISRTVDDAYNFLGLYFVTLFSVSLILSSPLPTIPCTDIYASSTRMRPPKTLSSTPAIPPTTARTDRDGAKQQDNLHRRDQGRQPAADHLPRHQTSQAGEWVRWTTFGAPSAAAARASQGQRAQGRQKHGLSCAKRKNRHGGEVGSKGMAKQDSKRSNASEHEKIRAIKALEEEKIGNVPDVEDYAEKWESAGKKPCRVLGTGVCGCVPGKTWRHL